MTYVPELREALVRAAERQARVAKVLPRWRRRLGGLGVALAAVAALAVVAVASLQGGSAAPPAAPAVTRPVDKAALAHRTAVQMLAGLKLPPGAVTVSADESIGHRLGAPPNGLQTPNLVDLRRFWRLPGDLQSVSARLQHTAAQLESPRSGVASSMGEATVSAASGGEGGNDWEAMTTGLPPVAGVIRVLQVQVAVARGGGTAVRIDAQSGWFPPRPADDQLHAAIDAVEVLLTSPQRTSMVRSRTIRSRPTIAALVAWLNALPFAGGHARACPPDWVLSFAGPGSAQPLARATVSITCRQVTLSLRRPATTSRLGGISYYGLGPLPSIIGGDVQYLLPSRFR